MVIQRFEMEPFVRCRNSQGLELRGRLQRLSRHLAVFEIQDRHCSVMISEVLEAFHIVLGEEVVFQGRAVVSQVVSTGPRTICEASFHGAWPDLPQLDSVFRHTSVQIERGTSLRELEQKHALSPDFQLLTSEMQTLLTDLQRWLGELELGVRSNPAGSRAQLERSVVHKISRNTLPVVDQLFRRFEETAAHLSNPLRPAHCELIKKNLHPLVLGAPFVYRTFTKPLGYAGDYEMVNMMLRDPLEGASMFAKLINLWFVNQPPSKAHQNRLDYLAAKLEQETLRVRAEGRNIRIFNLGCGPAIEVQRFLRQNHLADFAEFTLMDFNDETVRYTQKVLHEIRQAKRRTTPIQIVQQSVQQIIKQAARAGKQAPRQQYDFVYCAGLFDYLSDAVCHRILNLLYDWLAPGGLLVATNVDPSNPSRRTMEFVLDWHLIYRNRSQLEKLAPTGILAEQVATQADATGVNVYIEVRKPQHS